MTPWQAQYWQEVIAWGQKAKTMFTGQDSVPAAMIIVGGEAWEEVACECDTCRLSASSTASGDK